MPRVLIIDDDPAFCTLLRNFLTKNNYETQEAYSAKEGDAGRWSAFRRMRGADAAGGIA